MIPNDKLYENMIITEKKAYEAQDLMLDSIKKWFSKIMDQEASDNTKIILAQGGFIEIRTTENFDKEILDSFKKDFNFNLVWKRKENMIDFRNVESVSVEIFDYAFVPKDIKKLIGDNQVDFGD